MRRLRLTVTYDGTAYHGWQVQPGLPTIQGVLQDILADIEKAPVHVEGSGRTDAGVHAAAQIAAISLRNPIPPLNLKKALNRFLPPDIRILQVEEVGRDFHARYDALSKTYEYRIWRAEIVPPAQYRYVHHHPYPLDENALIASARLFTGEHDFSAFAASDERDALGHSKRRTIFCSEAERLTDMLVYRVNGSGFLKHMVRAIVGTLIEAGKANIDGAHIQYLLSAPQGVKATPVAPAKGLHLVRVFYP